MEFVYLWVAGIFAVAAILHLLGALTTWFGGCEDGYTASEQFKFGAFLMAAGALWPLLPVVLVVFVASHKK